MKKLFIGLLIIAAGAGIFYALRKQNKPHTDIELQKDLLIGNWKLDSIDVGKDSSSMTSLLYLLLDSALVNYRCNFNKDSTVYVSHKDSLIKDTSHYTWSGQNRLVFRYNLSEKDPDSLDVKTLTRDSLILQDRDSALLLFTKIR